MFTNKSDAALITFGCSVKSGSEFTNPEILTNFVILSNVPRFAFNCARPLIIQIFAASLAESTDCTFGTFPSKTTFPSFMGICPETKARFPVITTGMYDPAGLGGVGISIANSFNLSSIIKFCLDFHI